MYIMVVPSGGVVDYGIGVVQHWEPDVLVRPGWANAALALQQIDKVSDFPFVFTITPSLVAARCSAVRLETTRVVSV